jgi:hypothetical protein
MYWCRRQDSNLYITVFLEVTLYQRLALVFKIGGIGVAWLLIRNLLSGDYVLNPQIPHRTQSQKLVAGVIVTSRRHGASINS